MGTRRARAQQANSWSGWGWGLHAVHQHATHRHTHPCNPTCFLLLTHVFAFLTHARHTHTGHLTALYTGDFNSAPDRHLGSAELAAGGAGPAGCLMREPVRTRDIVAVWQACRDVCVRVHDWAPR